MNKTGFYLLRAFTWIFHKIPLRVHYIVSDVIFFHIYYIFRYRRKVVDLNLKNAFPEKSAAERGAIAKGFFHHFCDVFIETLYFDRISARESKLRADFTNPEVVRPYLEQGRHVVVMMGHYNNWESLCNWTLYCPFKIYAVYKKLSNSNFDLFYRTLRGRFGMIPLERSMVYRQLVGDQQKNTPTMSAFLFDQTPRIYEIHHWVNFLNQDTPVILGAEKVAQKLDAVVVFLQSRKVSRGRYEAKLEVVFEHAAQCSKYEITDTCTKLLEEQIRRAPEFWLWSHKRWKHKREDYEKTV